MKQDGEHVASRERAFAPIAAICAAIAGIIMMGLPTRQAQALPSFARQTGQPCGTCHTDYPALTPYGRRFKLYGYTIGGGKYRTTPFSISPKDKAEIAFEYAKAAALPFPALDSGKEKSNLVAYADTIHPIAGYVEESGPKSWVPPISIMGILGFTHTDSPQPPQTAPYKPNDVLTLDPVSFFWGGAITEHVGAFAQMTYAGPPPGGFSDAFGKTWTWDNTDIRYANATSVGGMDVVYGLTFNNNPTVQDLWNTTPAWGFPYAASTIAPGPSASTIIEGAFAAHVASAGAYAMINDILYLEVTGYRTLDFHTLNSLGEDPFDIPGPLKGVAPYWRVALEPHWGNHYFMLGSFGMLSKVNPWVNMPLVVDPTATFPQTDNFTDVGFDTQYQYQGAGWWLTLRGTLIREYQQLNASFANMLSANPTNQLNSLKLQGSLAFGDDNKIVLTAQHFRIWGTQDLLLFPSGSPDSDGWTAELAYIPFGVSKAPGWPWANVRLALQYTWNHRVDGSTFGAQNDNTIFLYAWFAM